MTDIEHSTTSSSNEDLKTCRFQSALFLKLTPNRPSPFFPRHRRFSSLSPSGIVGAFPTSYSSHVACAYSWKRNLFHNYLFCQIPSFSSKELALPRLVGSKLSRLRCHGHSLISCPLTYAR